MQVPALINAKLAVSNLHGPDRNVKNRHGSIVAFLNAVEGGIGGFNEFSTRDSAFFIAELNKRKLKYRRAGLNGIVWDPRIFNVGAPRIKKIMTGGHVGADGVHTAKPGDDDRRVGPNRFGIYFPCEVIAIGLDIEFVVTHLMARAFTMHKWRIPMYRRSIVSLAEGVLEEDGLMVGDFNTNPPVNLPGVADVNVPAPADMGRQHYTKIIRWGPHIAVSGVKDVNTPSDHDMLVGQVTFYKDAKDHVTPAKPATPPSDPGTKPVAHASSLPKPGAKGVKWRKYGAPVAHPWASVKRRRKRLRARILKWRAAYRRRLA